LPARRGPWLTPIRAHRARPLPPQRWLDALEAAQLPGRGSAGDGGGGEGLLAAQALYVLEVTRLRPDWADWSVADNTFASPEVGGAGRKGAGARAAVRCRSAPCPWAAPRPCTAGAATLPDYTAPNPGTPACAAAPPHQAMIVELRRNPGTDALLGLKESLDFASGAWSTLFCRMGGARLLSQVGGGAGRGRRAQKGGA
jgi:hypothetical protein